MMHKKKKTLILLHPVDFLIIFISIIEDGSNISLGSWSAVFFLIFPLLLHLPLKPQKPQPHNIVVSGEFFFLTYGLNIWHTYIIIYTSISVMCLLIIIIAIYYEHLGHFKLEWITNFVIFSIYIFQVSWKFVLHTLQFHDYSRDIW